MVEHLATLPRPPSRASNSRSTAPSSGGKGKEAAAITAAYQPQNQHLIVTPKEERVFGFGECVCERNNFKFAPKNMLPCECGEVCKCGARQYLPPFARRGKVCMCRNVRGAVYNVEIYRALNSRGGALWERFESEKKAQERNAGVEALGPGKNAEEKPQDKEKDSEGRGNA